MTAISRRHFQFNFLWMKIYKFRLKFHWCLFLRVQLTISQLWFRKWVGAYQTTSHYLNQWRIYASLGFEELTKFSMLRVPVILHFQRTLFRIPDFALTTQSMTQFSTTFTCKFKQVLTEMFNCWIVYITTFSVSNGPLARCVKLRVAHAPGVPGTFSQSPQVRDPAMHHVTCVTHVPWCMPESLTSGFLWSRWRGKRSRHSRHMRKPQFNVSGKRPMGPDDW